MKKLLLIICCMVGLQLQANAIVVEPAPIYYPDSSVNFSVNWNGPMYCEFASCYPYCCRTYPFANSIYIDPYNVGISIGWGVPYRHYRHIAPPPPAFHHRPAPVVHYANRHIHPAPNHHNVHTRYSAPNHSKMHSAHPQKSHMSSSHHRPSSTTINKGSGSHSPSGHHHGNHGGHRK